MTRRSYPLLLIFVDGVGLAGPGPDNPFDTVPTPALESLIGGPMTIDSLGSHDRCVLRALDACLGVEGLPQSATGQTTLLTGVNAQRQLGHHVPALPGPRLRAILRDHSVFRRALALGWRATFANPYSTPYLRAIDRGERQPSATTWAVSCAGLPLRREADLASDDAVAWDVCRDLFAEHASGSIPVVTPRQAGRHLARLALRYDFTMFETFLSDLAGHGRTSPKEAVERIDGLLTGVIDGCDDRLTVLMTSDHGNLEDLSTKSHTRNAVPLLAFGSRARLFAATTRLDEVTPRILTSEIAPRSS